MGFGLDWPSICIYSIYIPLPVVMITIFQPIILPPNSLGWRHLRPMLKGEFESGGGDIVKKGRGEFNIRRQNIYIFQHLNL